eukprot:scpid69779/ scgid2071/ 
MCTVAYIAHGMTDSMPVQWLAAHAVDCTYLYASVHRTAHQQHCEHGHNNQQRDTQHWQHRMTATACVAESYPNTTYLGTTTHGCDYLMVVRYSVCPTGSSQHDCCGSERNTATMNGGRLKLDSSDWVSVSRTAVTLVADT